jgi:hypothetical protein
MELFECERGHRVEIPSAVLNADPDGGLHRRCEETENDQPCGARLRVLITWR